MEPGNTMLPESTASNQQFPVVTCRRKGLQMVFKISSQETSRAIGMCSSVTPTFHSRKPHTKSRTGCINCKRRRVKCDENRIGGCFKCRRHGIDCDYETQTSRGNGVPSSAKPRLLSPFDLDRSQPGASTPVTFRPAALSTPLRAALTPMFPFAEEHPKDMTPVLQTLQHFDTVTYCSMGSVIAQDIIKECVHGVAVQKPYLLHAVSGVSAAHLCHLLPANQHPVQHRQSKLADAFHWHKALTLFRRELSSGVNRQNMDALISTNLLVCVHQFMLTDHLPNPGKSFVYAPPDERPKRTKWLTIQHGFEALRDELREQVWDSMWKPVLMDANISQSAPLVCVAPNEDEVHALFLDMCQVSTHSSADNNPYYTALTHLLFLRQLEPTMNTFNKLITFVGIIHGKYYRLLLERDKPALLILAHWLALMTELRQWWISGRSKSECIAITTFLKFDQDKTVRKLLEYPARVVGLAV
ncbi:hypothetical protein ABEF95_011005 [Exophiala dermatitidis]